MVVRRPGMRVSIQAKTGTGFSFGSGGGKKQTSGDDGRFLVEGAPAGAVQIVAIATDFMESTFGLVRQATSVKSGQTTDVGDLLVPTRKIKFRNDGVVDSGSRSDSEDKNLNPTVVLWEQGLWLGTLVSRADG